MTQPYLDHTYHGIGHRVDATGLPGRPEMLSGAFHLIARDLEGALLSDGEAPEEKKWIVYDLDALELAA